MTYVNFDGGNPVSVHAPGKCNLCGARLVVDWHSFCGQCYKRVHEDKLRKEGYDIGHNDGFEKGYALGMRAAGLFPSPRKGASPLDGMVDDLIRLCHPDLHSSKAGQERATRVMKVLNELRDRR